MEDKKILAGTALLNVYWNTRKKDLLDLIAPFIHYCTAQIVTPRSELCEGNRINLRQVTLRVRERFGYVDIPDVIIEKVYRRDQKHYRREKGRYYLIAPFDDLVEKMDKKQLKIS